MENASVKPASNKSFCGVFAVCVAGAFVTLAAVNYAVDPYAQYGSQILPPVVQTSRAEKLRLMERMADPPDGLILGSSRVLKIEPAYLASRRGGRFFNAGVNYGRPEDHLAWLRWYRQRFGVWPREVVLGLDVAGFVERPGPDARLLSQVELSRLIPEAIPWEDRLQRWKELLSWQQTRMSVLSLLRSARGQAGRAPDESFREDGVLVYHERERQIAAGEYDFREALAYNRREYRQLFADYDRLCPQRSALFRELVRLCDEHGVRLTVFLTPMHPELAEPLRAETDYRQRAADVIALIDSALGSCTGRGAPRPAFYDFSDVEAFAGDPAQFVDGIHPLEPNTRRMVERMTGGGPGRLTYVVQ